jgi:ABC-type Fe3+-hydroxamate transport system substrate-binding protein
MVPALKNDRLHILTDDNCLIPSPRYVEIIERVSRLLHPEAWDE